jgi:hypothetical protein
VEEIYEGHAMDIILDSLDDVALDFFEDATALQDLDLNYMLKKMMFNLKIWNSLLL